NSQSASPPSTAPASVAQMRLMVIVPVLPARDHSTDSGAPQKQRARRFRRALPLSSLPWASAAVAEQPQDEQEHVDEVEVEAERAHDGGLLRRLAAATDHEIHALDLLRV